MKQKFDLLKILLKQIYYCSVQSNLLMFSKISNFPWEQREENGHMLILPNLFILAIKVVLFLTPDILLCTLQWSSHYFFEFSYNKYSRPFTSQERSNHPPYIFMNKIYTYLHIYIFTHT